MFLHWFSSLNIFNAEKLVSGHVKKPIVSSFFNRLTFAWQLDVESVIK